MQLCLMLVVVVSKLSVSSISSSDSSNSCLTANFLMETSSKQWEPEIMRKNLILLSFVKVIARLFTVIVAIVTVLNRIDKMI